MPRPGQVLGLVGSNGTGKSTALKILAGKLKPNLGRFNSPPDWAEILTYFRGSELQNYFQKILEDNMKAIIKPQYVDHIPKASRGLSLGGYVRGAYGGLVVNLCHLSGCGSQGARAGGAGLDGRVSLLCLLLGLSI